MRNFLKHRVRQILAVFYLLSLTLNLAGGGLFAYAVQEGDGFEPPPTGMIMGHKFADLNRSGDWQIGGEPFLEGWEIQLYRDGAYYANTFTSPADGSYHFSDLPDGEYWVYEVLQEEEGWVQTRPSRGAWQVFIVGGSTYGVTDAGEFFPVSWLDFGNYAPLVSAFKYYDLNFDGEYNGEDYPLPGWGICLFNEDKEEDCRFTDRNGWVSWQVSPGFYWVEEVNQEGWAQTWPQEEGGYWVWVDEMGTAFYYYGDREWEGAYFGNWIEPGEIHAVKYQVSSPDGLPEPPDLGILSYPWLPPEWGEMFPPLSGWPICLSRWIEPWEDWLSLGCQETMEDGWVWWVNLAPGDYQVEEQSRDWWRPVTAPVWEGWLEAGGRLEEIFFLNWLSDSEPPQSRFDDPLDHEIIDTEIVSLSLSGGSRDNLSGVRNADLSVYRVGRGEEALQNYPAQSFFDVFAELNCETLIRRDPEEGGAVPIELVSLSLVSVDPFSVTWNHTWSPPSPGIYCFAANASDNAGNTEQTAFAGPLAYVPVPQISGESAVAVDTTSVTITWTTDHPSTSRVIYDPVSHPTLGDPPNYGYAFSTETFDTDPMVTEHSVEVTGLTPGTTYYYRTVSQGSPTGVGEEGSFTTEEGEVLGEEDVLPQTGPSSRGTLFALMFLLLGVYLKVYGGVLEIRVKRTRRA